MGDASVVGSGPNGLAAAVTLARAGLDVDLFERSDTLGGGARTKELTLPGFLHDVGSAVHPMGLASPFFRAFQLSRRIELIVPEISYVHPLSDGRAGVAFRDLARTAEHLGTDERAWNSLFAPLVQHINGLTDFTGSQLLRVPRDPVTAIRFGLRVLEQGSPAWGVRFREEIAPALLAGVTAHSIGRLPTLAGAGAGLVLGAHAHARGWPVPVGGSQAIIDAMRDDFVAHGGRVHTGIDVTDLRSLPSSRATLLDVSARALGTLARASLPRRYLSALQQFRYGDGVAKVDFALSAPVPWTNYFARQAVTLHVGGTRSEIARSEAEVASGRNPSNPYVLVTQPTVIDTTRAPAGKHVLWAYTHVPNGSNEDRTAAIVQAIERSAPGFTDTILASQSMSAMDLQEYDPNFIGGDISSGALTLPQMLRRPVISTVPWRTPAPGLYLASSSTPPGTGVHGLSGYYAARAALRDVFGLAAPQLSID